MPKRSAIDPAICLYGSTSRIARLIRPALPGTAIWAGRRQAIAGDLVFDLRNAPPEELRGIGALVLLAGSTDKLDQDENSHADLARAAARLCRIRNIGHLILMSSSAVYGGGAGLNTETSPLHPLSPYGRAKLRMEQAAETLAGADLAVTVLRIGNVAGADALLGGLGEGDVRLDVFSDGRGPRRNYIGPRVLAAALCALANRPGPQFMVMNLAQPEPVDMAELLNEAGIKWRARPAPDGALAEVTLDVARAKALLGDALPPARACDIVRDWTEMKAAL